MSREGEPTRGRALSADAFAVRQPKDKDDRPHDRSPLLHIAILPAAADAVMVAPLGAAVPPVMAPALAIVALIMAHVTADVRDAVITHVVVTHLVVVAHAPVFRGAVVLRARRGTQPQRAGGKGQRHRDRRLFYYCSPHRRWEG